MMRYIAGMFLAAIFFTLSGLHIYWASGGRFASAVTVPVASGHRTFNPSPLGTILVAAALFCAMLVVVGRLGVFGNVIPKAIFRWGCWALALIFFLRAIGEFRLVGFFKQVRDTPFAYWDTWLFSPLSLLIAMIALMLAYTDA